MILVIETILEHYMDVPSMVFVFMMIGGFTFSIFGLVKESKQYMSKIVSEKTASQDTTHNTDE